ncbi:uncharacterized protein SCHCODRAFT_02615810 [Schizophyllum commune H4-8]|nr:uncharacterized protein SCHCODRAFT_02615810 [Schizophyllum commune H4-8]KAI5896780.1 hypothetical protein SCHCODRAFT_02615810 [Schizophyllum commune H4-8]
MSTDVGDLLTKTGVSASLDHQRAGYSPTPRDALVLNTQLRLLDHADERLTSEIARLAELRDRVRKQAAIHTSLLSPCHRLPPELWSTIFLMVLGHGWSSDAAGARPFRIAQVCHRWRAIIFQTPQLWTDIYIRPCRGPDAQMYNVEGIKNELARTGRAPLNVHVDLIDEDEHMRFRERVRGPFRAAFWSTDIWEALCAHVDHWESAFLGDVSASALAAYTYRPLTFPALRFLSLRTHNEDDPDITTELPLRLFSDAPNLENLRIQYWEPPAVPLLLPSSWRLTRLVINCELEPDAPLSPCLPLILACTSLVVCEVSAPVFGAPVEGHTRAVFPALQQLSLMYAGIHFCRLMSAPALEYLYLGEMPLEDSPVNEITAFESLLDNSNDCPSLRDLDLRGFDCTAREVVRCPARLPHLERLSVRNNEYFERMEPPASMDLIRALTRDSPASLAFLPRLEYLDLGYAHGNENPEGLDEAMGTMMQSRMRPSPLTAGQSLVYLRRSS